MAEIEHPDITRARETGYHRSEYLEHERYKVPHENYLVENHPVEDMFGTEITSGDAYFIDEQDRVVDCVNMEQYLVEVVGVGFFKAK